LAGIHNFSVQQAAAPVPRNIDNDAPVALRQQLLAITYDLLPQAHGFSEGDLYYGIEQMLGVQAAGNPMGGRRQRLGRDLGLTEWQRVYDVICWLWNRFQASVLHEAFRQQINIALAASHVVWDLGADGNMHRVLPAAVQAQVQAAFAELSDAQYVPALVLFNAAQAAYDEHPRQDRNACSNIFDAMESVAKIKYNKPNESFGHVMNHAAQHNLLRAEILATLRVLNDIRNHQFGHAMVLIDQRRCVFRNFRTPARRDIRFRRRLVRLPSVAEIPAARRRYSFRQGLQEVHG
jgi:hypothetical protein